ncbi:septum formation initiator family protein [Microbacterium sp. NC79]|uniref:FtsB family cell division protein n=1 Tax=Microbacterium sp. NC79 TaxID=2851009 RepID=UPI001C2C9028|nr:septum formation initiator family protein [Microbacterium sp. NC79]MBV0894420.1 septum formation initiator family protein [Microbacterium sp. NC79]
MARRPDFPSRVSTPVTGPVRTAPVRTGKASPARRRVDVSDWLGGIRFSGFMAIMLSLVVLAVFVLVPSIGTYLEQRQRIASLQEAVAVSQAEVDRLEAERDRWTDANYIASQARERLYYVKPGEVVYLVDNDIDESLLPMSHGPVSDKVEKTKVDWMTKALRSVTESGLAQSVMVPEGATDTPEPTEPAGESGEQTDLPTP